MQWQDAQSPHGAQQELGQAAVNLQAAGATINAAPSSAHAEAIQAPAQSTAIGPYASHSAASSARPGHQEAPMAREGQMPWRLHLEAGADGHVAWIAMRQSDADWQAALPAIVQEIERTLSAQGKELAFVICNGQPIWQSATRASRARPDEMPASSSSALWVSTPLGPRSFNQLFEDQ